MAENNDRPVTAVEVAELSHEILARMSDLAERPYALIAALKSAAANIENALTSNMMKTTIAAAITNIFNAGRRP